jgi:hypothetical protein
MAAIQGHDAALYAQVVDGPSATTEFELGGRGTNDLHRTGVKGKSLFTALSNGDTICYRAVSLDDPSDWEVGIATYDSTNEQLDRTNANVVASSNSNNRVNFKKSDGSGTRVLVEGISGVELTNAWAITNWTADRSVDCDTVIALSTSNTYTDAAVNTAVNAALAIAFDAIGSLTNDLIEAGVITGTVSA